MCPRCPWSSGSVPGYDLRDKAADVEYANQVDVDGALEVAWSWGP